MQKNKLSDLDRRIHQDGFTVWYAKDTSDIVCTLSLTPQRGQLWISGLYVSPAYRHRGFCRALLDYATFNGGDHLCVKPDDEAAGIYRKYGFIVYDRDDDFLYMSINTKTEMDGEQNA